MDSPTLRFTGHETFPLRYLWPAKCVRAIQGDPLRFARDAARVEFGVGKTMVRSIRHWCETLELMAPAPDRPSGLRTTSSGERLFGADGWDPRR